jgi:hypothetical protein
MQVKLAIETEQRVLAGLRYRDATLQDLTPLCTIARCFHREGAAEAEGAARGLTAAVNEQRPRSAGVERGFFFTYSHQGECEYSQQQPSAQ